jgi:hypothetical protein
MAAQKRDSLPVTRKRLMKTPAESSPRGNRTNVSAVVVSLLAELHTHKQAVRSEAQQVERIARRIERLMKASAHTLSRASNNSGCHRNCGKDPYAHCKRPNDHANEQANLFRFSKLL